MKPPPLHSIAISASPALFGPTEAQRAWAHGGPAILLRARTFPLVVDIGMYDGSDTQYYLETRHRVVAIEANPALVRRAESEFESYLRTGQLSIINAAITSDGSPIELVIDPVHLSASHVATTDDEARSELAITVPGITPHSLLAQCRDRAKYVKVDIEGADGLCIAALTAANRPEYVSCEISENFADVLDHLVAIGFSRFKIIHQGSFREIANRDCLRDRLVRKLMRLAGMAEPRGIRRAGRFFTTGNSSGPAPWESDGPWSDRAAIARKWHTEQTLGLRHNYDLQAC